MAVHNVIKAALSVGLLVGALFGAKHVDFEKVLSLIPLENHALVRERGKIGFVCWGVWVVHFQR